MCVCAWSPANEKLLLRTLWTAKDAAGATPIPEDHIRPYNRISIAFTRWNFALFHREPLRLGEKHFFCFVRPERSQRATHSDKINQISKGGPIRKSVRASAMQIHAAIFKYQGALKPFVNIVNYLLSQVTLLILNPFAFIRARRVKSEC